MSKNKKVSTILILLSGMVALTTACTSIGKSSVSVEGKPVILVAAFGSSYETGQKNLEDFDKAIRVAYPENEVVWGFTASFIVKKLKKEGRETVFASKVPVQTIEEAMANLSARGNPDVVVVNLLLMVGQEYREVLNTPTNGMNVKYVHPLLYYPENIQNAVKALEHEIGGEDTATVFCAHGNEHHPEYNAELIEIDQYLQENYKNTYLAVMEGVPPFAPVKEAIAASGVSKVKFVTFMLTFGDHMSNDVMGDEPDSLKMQIGLPAGISDGLASLPTIQNMYIQKIKSTLAQF